MEQVQDLDGHELLFFTTVRGESFRLAKIKEFSITGDSMKIIYAYVTEDKKHYTTSCGSSGGRTGIGFQTSGFDLKKLNTPDDFSGKIPEFIEFVESIKN